MNRIYLVIIILALIIIVGITYNYFNYNTELFFSRKKFNVSSLDIVISHYSSPLDWINMDIINKTTSNKKLRFFIYTKGKNDPDLSFIKNKYPESEVIYEKIDNVGMCDHTYLYHIIKNYNNLANATYFLTDSSTMPHKIVIFNNLFKIDRSGEYFYFGAKKCENLTNWKQNYYTPTCQRDHIKINLKVTPAPTRPYGKWFKSITGFDYKRGLFGYGGIFMASKNAIKKRDVSFYEKIIDQMVDVHSEIAHYMERLWYWVFDGPVLNKYKLALLAIVKNEEMVIEEWLDHYRWQGVERFYIIDNNSTDNTCKILNSQPDVTYFMGQLEYNQTNYYNDVFNYSKGEYEWLIVCDCDEYIYNRQSGKKITDYLKTINDSRVILDWKMFTSNGFKKQPKSIRKSFIKTNKNVGNHGKYSKCIVKSDHVIKIDIHLSKCSGTTVINPEQLALNHYAIMSLEYFQNVKMNRGDAENKASNNIRDMEYLKKYDVGDDIDTELRDLVIEMETNC